MNLKNEGNMKKAIKIVLYFVLFMFGAGLAQKYPLPRDIVRITLVDGRQIVDKVRYASKSELCLEAVVFDYKKETTSYQTFAWSDISKMEKYRGKEMHFFQNFFLGWAGTTVTAGLVSAAMWEPCEETGFLSCMLHPASRAEAFGIGAYTGAFIGIPVGLVTGMTIGKKMWEPFPVPYETPVEFNSAIFANMMMDIDGNLYRIITIGAQTWMTENLRVSRYRNGDPILPLENESAWHELTEGAWCVFENDSARGEVYGKLYNWYALADKRKIAPAGWRIPTQEDWDTLIDALGGPSEAGAKLKQGGLHFWQSQNIGSTNENGFCLLPAGSRSATAGFVALGQTAFLWSATDHDNAMAWSYSVQANRDDIVKQLSPKYAIFSIRCVRD
jgi:uncharacterized protein (TIGR02145 family)